MAISQYYRINHPILAKNAAGHLRAARLRTATKYIDLINLIDSLEHNLQLECGAVEVRKVRNGAQRIVDKLQRED